MIEDDDGRDDERVSDRVSDIMMLSAAAFVVLMLTALAVLDDDAVAREPGRPGGAHVSATERTLRAWCPAPDVMPRRRCVGWMRVAQCETGDPADRVVTRSSLRRIRWRYDGRSGHDGALQFSPRTWSASIGRVPARSLTRRQYIARARGAYGAAYGSPPMVQVLAAEALRVRRDGGGLGHWPRCGARWRD